MKRPLPVPVQGTNLTDKDGKPTTHNYRWMESLGSSLTDTQDEISNKFANVTGSAPLYYCRAWVNFDGTKDTNGTTSTANTNRFIRSSGNVTSVLRNAVGDYTVNFTTAMPDANYAINGSGMESRGLNSGASFQSAISLASDTTILAGSVRILNANIDSTTNVDGSYITVTIFR